MRILYGYSNCTDKTYNRIVSERNVSVLQPDQKYHGLLIKGLAKNGAEVRCFTGLPVNRAVTSRKIIREKDEREGNAFFHYITTVNLPVLRQLMIFFGTFFGVLKAKKDQETYAVCDCLNFANAYGMIFAAKLRRIKTMLIVTDLPDVQTKAKLRPWLNGRIFSLSDAFLFLTEQMNPKLNKKNKPYIVLEGHVDADMPALQPKPPRDKGAAQVVMYAGSLHRIYGICNLTEGFLAAAVPGTELHVYGDGDFKDELVQLSRQHPSVRYQGIKMNAEIVQKEYEASVLVNPRPVNQEFTPYSFPSKTLEYMMSGTPVITTRLPGIPEEYFDVLYVFQDDTPQGIADTLRDFFGQPEQARLERGMQARKFAEQNKSNVAQSHKILEFLKRL